MLLAKTGRYVAVVCSACEQDLLMAGAEVCCFSHSQRGPLLKSLQVCWDTLRQDWRLAFVACSVVLGFPRLGAASDTWAALAAAAGVGVCSQHVCKEGTASTWQVATRIDMLFKSLSGGGMLQQYVQGDVKQRSGVCKQAVAACQNRWCACNAQVSVPMCNGVARLLPWAS